jgi:hypothetical protein
MGLLGNRTEVTVEPERAEVVAGEPLRVRVSVGEPDGRVQGGRVELLYRNTYREEDVDRDSDGDARRVVRTRTADVVVAAEPLFAGGVPAEGAVDVELAVPPDAPGSASGSVAWAVRAVVDRRRSRDANDERPLTVLVGPGALEPWAERAVSAPPQVPMRIDAGPRVLRPGDTVEGTLTVRPTAPVSARSLRVQLTRRRRDSPDLTDEETPAVQPLLGEVELVPGEERTFPFALAVPPDAAPSFAAAHNTQHWYVEGVVDRPMRGDHVARLEVVVHTA